MFSSSSRRPQATRNQSYSTTSPHSQVRALWRRFEQNWAQPHFTAMAKRKIDLAREEDVLWANTPPRIRATSAEHKKHKLEKVREIESAHYDAARREWSRMLAEANLHDEAWGVMTDEEQKAVDKALGGHLAEHEDDSEVEIVQSSFQSTQSMISTASYVQAQAQQLQASTSSLSSASSQPPLTPQSLQPPPTPMTSSSRAANISNNSYEFVSPHMFGSDEDDALFKMPPKDIISEDEDIGIPLRAGWGTESSGYTTTWSSSSRGGSTQSSHHGSPEFGAGNALPQSAAAAVASASLAQASSFSSSLLQKSEVPARSSSGGSGDRKLEKSATATATVMAVTTSTTTSTSTSTSSSAKQRVPGLSYIGPILSTPTEPSDEEAEFEKFKMRIRIQKIIEFHQEAARAGIKLALDIHNAHKSSSSSSALSKGKGRDDAAKVAEHERVMRELQIAKEEERRVVVGEERERRRAEIRKRGRGKVDKPAAFEEGEFDLDLDSRFEFGEIVGGVNGGAEVLSASVSSLSSLASASASQQEEERYDMYTPSSSSFSSQFATLPPTQRDEDEEYDGEEDEIPSDFMAAVVAGGGLDTQQDWLFGSSTNSSSTTSAASSIVSSLASSISSLKNGNSASASSAAAQARKNSSPNGYWDDSWDKGKARESTGAGVAGLGAWGGMGQSMAQGSKESEGVWGMGQGQKQRSSPHTHEDGWGKKQQVQRTSPLEEGVWGKTKAQVMQQQQQQEEGVWGKTKAQVMQQQQEEGVWGKTKAQVMAQQQQEEGVWGKTKAQLHPEPEAPAPWDVKRGVVPPPASATPVQSGWKKSGAAAAAAAATPVQSGWASKGLHSALQSEGRSTPSLFGEDEDSVTSKVGARGLPMKGGSFASSGLRKTSLLADEPASIGKSTPSATPSAPIPVANKKMTKKQRQEALKKGFNAEHLDGEEEEHEGYKSSDLLSTPRPSKNPFFEQWDHDGPSTPRPFQTRGLSHETARPSGLRNEVPVPQESGEFWMPGAAKGSWAEPEQAEADMWAAPTQGKSAGGKQFWNSMLKEKNPQSQAQPAASATPQGTRAGRKSAFEVPAQQESATPASLLRKGKAAAKGKAKPVMVEEVPDEEEESFDNLPVDSRYILEPKQPKPQAPPAAFDNIISYQPDYSLEEEEEEDEEEYDDMGWSSSNIPTPSTARTSPPEPIDLDVDREWFEQAQKNFLAEQSKMQRVFAGDALPSSNTVKGKQTAQPPRWGTSLGQHQHDSSSSSSSNSSPFLTDTEQYRSAFEMGGNNKRALPTKQQLAPEPPKIPTPPKVAPKVPSVPVSAPAAPPAPQKAAVQAAPTPIEKAKAPAPAPPAAKPEPEPKKNNTNNNKSSKAKGKRR